MRLIRNLSCFPLPEAQALTIGNFDGIHLGHQAILRLLKENAVALNLTSAVLSFEPQPLEYFLDDHAPARLSRFLNKYSHISKFGIDRFICLRFNQNIVQMNAVDFIERVLIEQFNTKLLVVGDDFTFGADRKGNFELLEQYSEKYQFKLIRSNSFLFNSERVSSTKIRALLAEGRFKEASDCLGYNYYLTGRVCHGNKLGRQLGFPTANIILRRKVLPLRGVFVVKVNSDTLTDAVGVANIGIRPTVSGKQPQMEVHLFNCDQNLYQQRLVVEFLHKLRDEQKFANVDELKRQIAQDVQDASDYLARI